MNQKVSLIGTPANTEGSCAKPSRPVVDLTSVVDDLDAIVEGLDGRPATLRELEIALQGRGSAVLILLLSIPFLFPIAIPLMSTAFGLPMVLMGLRMAVSREVRLPRFAHKRKVSAENVRRIAAGLRRVLRPVGLVFRPRLAGLFWPMPWHVTGLGIGVAAGVLSLPLPVPFANMIPAIALMHYAAGLIQRDGIAILVGHVVTLAAVGYLWLIGDSVVRVVSSLVS